MNIRDHHAKYDYNTRIDPAERFAERARNYPQVGHRPTDSEPSDFSKTLAALSNTEPNQIADVMSAIAEELRAAADNSGGPQSGILDALAARFETAATTVAPADAAETSATAVADDTTNVMPASSEPKGPHGHRGHREHWGHHGEFGFNPSGNLLAKIMDAVNDALAKVTVVPAATSTETAVPSATVSAASAAAQEENLETSVDGAA